MKSTILIITFLTFLINLINAKVVFYSECQCKDAVRKTGIPLECKPIAMFEPQPVKYYAGLNITFENGIVIPDE